MNWSTVCRPQEELQLQFPRSFIFNFCCPAEKPNVLTNNTNLKTVRFPCQALYINAPVWRTFINVCQTLSVEHVPYSVHYFGCNVMKYIHITKLVRLTLYKSTILQKSTLRHFSVEIITNTLIKQALSSRYGQTAWNPSSETSQT
jgi:hypothetical protein